jgi:carbon-monoxide dehydrogenase large subunit
MTSTEVGSYRKRVEDPRLLRGEGQYVEDLQLQNVAEVAFLRSAHAHARIAQLDVEAARRAPGVLAVWTGEDVHALPRIPSTTRAVSQHHLSPLPPLAWPDVSLAGYPLAAVVATDRQTARDAVDLIDVDYEPLPTITDAEAALAPEAPLVYPEFGTNLAYTVTRSSGDVDRDLSQAFCSRCRVATR